MDRQPEPLGEASQQRTESGQRGRHPGQVIVLFALFVFVLVGFVALAIDAGFLLAERRQAQSRADGAAMAADKAYQRNEMADIVPTGIDYATESGDFDASEVTITPMASYTVNGQSYVMCVEATIDHDVDPFFVGVFLPASVWSISATGVACTEPVAREYAIIALDEDGRGINAGGTADMTITGGGGAMSNADSDYCGSSAWIQADGPLDSYDGIDICNNTNVVSLPPNPSAAQVLDPLAGIAEPSCAGLPVYNNANPTIYYPLPLGEPDVNVRATDPLVLVYPPGNYTNGIQIRGTHEVLFQPGLYCIGGQGLDLRIGNSATLDVIGDDVMFYMYGNNSLFNVDAQGVDLFISNLDGNACGQPACEAGVIIFYSRGIVSGQPEDCTDLVLNGNVVTVEGILYALCTEIRLEGNGDLTVTGQVLGAEILVRGGNQVVVNYLSDLVTAPPQVYLVD